MNAPTAKNAQTWRFMVIKNRDILDKIADLSPYMKMMKTAPCAIMVLGDMKKATRIEYLYYDASAAIENMLIEACHLGLGSCWCAIGPNEERVELFKKEFDIEESLYPVSVVSFGISDEEKTLIDRYDPEKVVYLD